MRLFGRFSKGCSSRLKMPLMKSCCNRKFFYGLEQELRKQQAVFESTGGLHASALFDLDGNFISVREDVGRHNALDKLLGYALQQGMSTRDLILVFSGRMSSEVVLKAAKIGVGVLLSKSAPTDLALKLAQDLGITCVGFIRRGEMNVYTHPERIAGV